MVDVIGDIQAPAPPVRCGGRRKKGGVKLPTGAEWQAHYDAAVKILHKAGRPTNFVQCGTFYIASEEGVFGQHRLKATSAVGEACHYAMSLTGISDADWKPIILASNFNFNPLYEEQSLAFWEWITSSDSPWKALMTEGKPTPVMDKDGKMCGFFWTPDQLRTANFRFFKNFSICARQVMESPSYIKLWYSLTKLGLDPRDAFLGATAFFEDAQGYVHPDNSKFHGIHWPVTLTWSAFSYQTFFTGDINLEAKNVNGFFGSHGTYKTTPDAGLKIRQETKPGGDLVGFFTKTTVFGPEQVAIGIKEFLKNAY